MMFLWCLPESLPELAAFRRQEEVDPPAAELLSETLEQQWLTVVKQWLITFKSWLITG